MNRVCRFHNKLTFFYCSEEEEFLLIAQRNKVSRLNLEDLEKLENIPLPEIKNVIAVEYDFQENTMFWADIETDKIFVSIYS